MGSKVCSINSGSRAKSSAPDRAYDGIVLSWGVDKFRARYVVDFVRWPDSGPDPSDPDQSAVKAEPRREDDSG
jgi:hypothetical protein